MKPVVKKNQPSVDHITGNKIPKSFVFSRGKLPGPLRQLQMDLRKLMLPYTALNLKVKIIYYLLSFRVCVCVCVSSSAFLLQHEIDGSAHNVWVCVCLYLLKSFLWQYEINGSLTDARMNFKGVKQLFYTKGAKTFLA